MFCFGGIGATPDDYTREIAEKVSLLENGISRRGKK